MVLEAVTLCLDNSEWMRNGDYHPSRLGVQNEAASYIANLKNHDNRETSIGVLTMAGKRIDVLLTPDMDLGHVLSSLNSVKIGGTCNFVAGLKTAQLCLKNRLNKNQHQRIIMFVGSPIDHPTKDLVKLGKMLKKHNIAVDVINFGQENTENENSEKLDAFIQAVNSSDNSKLVVIPPGPHSFTDMIVTTIFADAAGNVPGAGGDFQDFGQMDPEMELAIRMSLDEEKARQDRAAKDRGETETPQETMLVDQEPGSKVPTATEAGAEDDDMDEDEVMAMALAMSMEQHAMDVDDSKVADAMKNALKDQDFMSDLLADLDVDASEVDVDVSYCG